MELVENNRKSSLIFSNFILKIIAIITMTLDHVGQAISIFYPYQLTQGLEIIILILRILGRIALPLFCFMIAEGMEHTSNSKKYMLRLGILALLISIFLLACYYIPNNNIHNFSKLGNIFIDLLLGALSIYLLKQERILPKLLLIPILLFAFGSSAVKSYEVNTGGIAYFFPDYIRMQYDWYSLILIIGFYLIKYIARWLIDIYSETYNLKKELFLGNNIERFLKNILSILFLVIITICVWLFYKYNPKFDYINSAIQSYAIMSCALILLYNEKRGYNAKWFQYGCYAYYPLHIAIILVIFVIIYGI